MFTSDYSQPITSNWSLEDMVALEQNYDSTTNNQQFQYNNDNFILNPNQLPLSNPMLSSASTYGYNTLMDLQSQPINNNFSSILPNNNLNSELYSENIVTSPSPSVSDEPIKLKPGRKRKDEKVDREALKKDRMIRNRLAAQRSRERKRKEVLSVEKDNIQLKERNKELETRVVSLEASNLDLMKKLEALSSQMQAMQSQMQFNNLSSLLFNRFGETAELVDRSNINLLFRSQQRKRMNQYLTQHYQTVLMTMQTMHQTYFLLWWTTHLWAICSIYNGQPLTINSLYKNFSNEFYLNNFKICLSKISPKEITDVFDEFKLKFKSDFDFNIHHKWLPP